MLGAKFEDNLNLNKYFLTYCEVGKKFARQQKKKQHNKKHENGEQDYGCVYMVLVLEGLKVLYFSVIGSRLLISMISWLRFYF